MSLKEVEILVHIAAPSTTANDANYRSLARAYLDFKPRSRTSIFNQQELSTTTNGDGVQDDGQLARQGGGSASQLQGTQRFINTPDVSFSSVFGNMSSPDLPHAARPEPQNTMPDTQSSWVAPPSVIQDSMPDNNPAISQFNSPTRMFEYFLSGLNSSQSDQFSISDQGPLQLGPSQPSIEEEGQPAIESSLRSNQGSGRSSIQPVLQPSQQSEGGSCRGNTTVYSEFEVPSQMGWSQLHGQPNMAPQPPTAPTQPKSTPASTPPPMPQTSQEPGDGRQRRPRNQPAGGSQTIIPVSPLTTAPKRPPPPSSTSTSIIEETRIASSFPSHPTISFGSVIPSSYPQSPSSHPKPHPSPSRAGSEPATKRLRTSPAPLARSSSDVGPLRPATTTAHRKQPSTRLEIISPPPPTSLADLTPADLITPALSHLAAQVDISRRFTPQTQTRALRPFERGYWLVDCTSWDEELRASAWAFLGNHVEGGLVGWGVSCRRDPGFTWIRVYCWGAVVGHVYLVLWLASQRRVKATGTVWVAGDGEGVVVMAARPGSR